ncbi:MAG TPA: RagB/SusD family nutrient uptake outer membrane protein, partial [Flavisolibacter sp.]|nr:RagB/SusD family nutrient uptake outer membrane protein [Flavisolibacter sp.]
MKKFLPILLVLFAAGFGSCKKFLEEKQVANLTQDYYNTEEGVNSLINGLYVYARVKHEWDANGARLTQAETDAYMTAANTFATMPATTYGSNVSNIAGNMTNYIGAANAGNAPMGAYPHINNCNIGLDIIDNLKPGKFGTDETYRKQKRSEILFLRAWAYYLVSNQLGDVPLLLIPKREDAGIYHYPKAKLEDIYRQMIADTRFAYENLPPTQAERGRVSKLAAGHLLAKLYLARAQAASFQNSSETHLKMLYKGSVPTDLDSVITYTTEVINANGGPGGLAPDYWTLFDPKVSETTPHKEVLWAAQFDISVALNGRFGGNRSVNYHIGNYTDATGVTRNMAYGRPFGVFKPTDFGYDVFADKVHDSRYYKTFQYEYISNATGSFTWTAPAAAWWNANKPAGEPTVVAGQPRAVSGKRALIFLENQITEPLDSTMVMSLPYQFIVRWVRSSVTNRLYYRLNYNQTNLGLNTGAPAPYFSVKKYTDPLRGGSSDESNFNSESGTRDAILMRLAETYLVRAEAYGRKGQYPLAVADINVLRQRAAYKSGEARPNVLVEWEPMASTLSAAERVAPYAANGSSANAIRVTENHFTPGAPESAAEMYIPTAASKADMFIHFIYNEKTRELLSEGMLWEDLHNAGILYERTIYLNQ